jgi:hypothetical protein
MSPRRVKSLYPPRSAVIFAAGRCPDPDQDQDQDRG